MQMKRNWQTQVTCVKYSSVHRRAKTTLVYNFNFKDPRNDCHERRENTSRTGNYFALIPYVAMNYGVGNSLSWFSYIRQMCLALNMTPDISDPSHKLLSAELRIKFICHKSLFCLFSLGGKKPRIIAIVCQCSPRTYNGELEGQFQIKNWISKLIVIS